MPPFLRTAALTLLLACSSILPNSRVFASLTPSLSAPIVDLGYAQYQGSVDINTNVTSVLSIRYAAPPIGPTKSPNILDATTAIWWWPPQFEGKGPRAYNV
ncbi:hypothetical protein BJ138DRAFT_1106030 [Hygrophoropsis aurantiaca]|uniref:Uncharacterized protein n=1 Tax=Hygrophoropsis aurantiaca TaxID=72124 RepID=A0ACB7ZWY1_9AGAM|nr:hypothetical protein BJ138DRAFT_1106030 [Hygrophoropsis aurantiaca]